MVRTASGWYARILQHEVDHLNGMLCIDRMDPRTFVSVELYQQFWQDGSIAEVRAELGPLTGVTSGAAKR